MPDASMYRVRSASEGWGGAPGLNTFYFLDDEAIQPDPDAGALDCVTRVHDFWTTSAINYTQQWNVQVSPVVDIINADNGELTASHVTTVPELVAGGGNEGFGPQVAMICANLLTTVMIDGRRVHGRAFLGPLKAIDDTNGTPQTIALTTFQTALETLMGGTLTHVPLVVWSRPRGNSLRHPAGLGGTAPAVSGILMKDSYAILRSRRQ